MLTGIKERVRDLFWRTRKVPTLSDSTVVHDRLDDAMLEDMLDLALHFRRAHDDAPYIDPDQLAGAEDLTPEQREQLSGEYTAWGDLFKDVFRALHTLDGPELLSPDEIKPSRELNRRIIQQMVTADGFTSLRPNTRLDEIASTFTTMSLAPRLREALMEHLAEFVARTKDMEEQEEKIENAQDAMDGIREQVQAQGGEATPDQADAIREQAQTKSAARAELAEQQAQQQQQGMVPELADAIEEAVEEAQKDANLIGSLPGTEPGTGNQLSPNEMIELAQKWRDNYELRQIAEMCGRLQRDIRYKRANRVIGGHEEIWDVKLGDDLTLVLPSELMRLDDDLLELDFLRRFYERSLLQYETRGYAEAGRGPLIVCVDGSSSMNGMKNVWSRAVALSFIAIARREKRDSAAVEFSSAGEQKRWDFLAREPLDQMRVLDFASHQFAGGTDITGGVRLAKEMIDGVPQFHSADVIVSTDGQDRYRDDDEELRRSLVERGVRLHGVAIGSSAEANDYLQAMCETTVAAYDLAGSNDATDHLAEVIS